jgi:hypothetical protein
MAFIRNKAINPPMRRIVNNCARARSPRRNRQSLIRYRIGVGEWSIIDATERVGIDVLRSLDDVHVTSVVAD